MKNRLMASVWELVIVLAAALAVLTNILVIGTIHEVQRDVVRLTSELYSYELKVDRFSEQLAELDFRLTELEAQVRYGLGQRYDIKED